MRKQVFPKVDAEYVPFRGGLLIGAPPSRVPSGALLNCVNYEPDVNGGYRRLAGYERFSGRPRPSQVTYQSIACTLQVTPTAGDTVTIGVASGRFIKVVTGGILLANVSGTVPGSTAMFVGPTNIGSTSSTSALAYSPSSSEHSQNLVDAGVFLRADISAPTGSGPIRGVLHFSGSWYCWRDDVGASYGVMYKATPTGWQAVTMAEEVTFSNANTSVGEGDTLTQGGVTATIRRVIVETGTLVSGTNTGRLVISGRSGGVLASGAATSTGGGALTLGGASVAQSFPPGGKYRSWEHNFFAADATRRVYSVNGVGRAFEFDGNYVAFINTGSAVDTPSYVCVHLGYLMLAQGASLIASSAGDPHRYVTSEGAAEIGVGGTITGIATLAGEALGITTRKFTKALIGKDKTVWALNTIAPKSGGVDGSLQLLDVGVAIDDSGVISISPTQQYGDFTYNPISGAVQALVNDVRGLVVDSCVVATRKLYRVFCSDGRVISMFVGGRRVEFGALILPAIANVAYVAKDESGIERVMIGGSDGHVYELDVGSTMDGADLSAGVRVWYTSNKRPRIDKHYRGIQIEMTAELYSAIQIQPDFSYASGAAANVETADTAVSYGAGGIWETSNWDEFFWDAAEVSAPEVPFDGDGRNVALTFYSSGKLDRGHVLQGVFLQQTNRKLAKI
jgi:hypothetical protein